MLQLDDCRIAILDTGRLVISPSDNFMETYSHRITHLFDNPDELLKALQSTPETHAPSIKKINLGEMDEDWYLEQIKKVDDFMQDGKIPEDIKFAYFHGMRGWICSLSSKVAIQSQPESQYPTETYEEIEEKQRKALMSVLPRMKLCNSESLCNNCLRILDDIIKAVENPEAIIGDE